MDIHTIQHNKQLYTIHKSIGSWICNYIYIYVYLHKIYLWVKNSNENQLYRMALNFVTCKNILMFIFKMTTLSLDLMDSVQWSKKKKLWHNISTLKGGMTIVISGS